MVRWWRGAATLVLALSCWTGLLAQARAEELVDVGPNPVVNVQLGTGTVTFQTWDRPQVQVSGDGEIGVQHLPPSFVDPNVPHQMQLPAHSIETEHGEISLPEDSFVMPPLQGAVHDEVQARGNGNTVIYVPRGTAAILAHVDKGRVTLNDYHGVFFTQVHNGGVFLNRVNGSGYVESLRGRIVATDSTFDRVRARSATSNITFNNCTSHQIEATSRYGSIVYNNGSFEPGLARFDSEHGNVALGVRGGAQIGAHSESGHVVSSFSDGTQTRGSSNTTQARVQGGGPVVTATSRDGSVFLYNGSLREHPEMQEQLRTGRQAQVMRSFEPAGTARGFYPPSLRQYEPGRTFAAPPPAQPRQYAPQPAHQYGSQQAPRQMFAPPTARQERREEQRQQRQQNNGRPPQ